MNIDKQDVEQYLDEVKYAVRNGRFPLTYCFK